MMSIKHYTDPELLEINALENAIYMAMQNDVSFMIGLRLSLYEHQSTFNPNLPLSKLELEAVMLNINLGHNPALMNACTMLHQYAEYTDRVRRYTKTMSLEDAVEHAITECIHEGILKSFLEKNRAEVKNVCIYEYDEEEHIRLERSYAWEDGKKEGLKEGIRKGEKGKTCNLIQKKLEKGKTLSQIADELEDTEENIGRLIEQFHLGIPQ